MADYLTVDETAQELGYHPASVRRMLRAGRLCADKKAGIWLVYTASVREYKLLVAGRSKHDPWAIGAR